MKDNVDYLPIWKAGATAAERLSELSFIARKYPDKFNKVAVIYQEKLAGNRTVTRVLSFGCTTNELLGIIDQGRVQVYKDTDE